MSKKIEVHRITDTVKTNGRQEYYIQFSMTFLKFFKRNFKEIPKTIDAEKLAQKYNLRGFSFGNYVTQEERFFYLYKIEKQLEILAKIKQSNDLGLGALTIAVGSEGKSGSLAHFNPKKLLINLNRGRRDTYSNIFQGESSLIHEYGHFIDFISGRSITKGILMNFASEAPLNLKIKRIEVIRNPVNLLQNSESYISGLKKHRNAKYLMQPWEIWARLFEKTVYELTIDDQRFSNYYKYVNKVFGNYDSNIYPGADFVKDESTIIDIGLSLRSIKSIMIKNLGFDYDVANRR